MKKLYLVRHAKASWDMPGLSDIDRPLLPKGVKRTNLVIEYLKNNGTSPDLIISSPAVRAFETAKLVASGLDYPLSKIKTDRKIYDGYYDRMLDLIYGTGNEIDSLMLFGHNPTMTHLANLFLNPGIDNMQTSCVVCISFDTEKWETIPAVEAHKEFIVYPKMLK